MAEVGYLALAYLWRRAHAGGAPPKVDDSTTAAWAVSILASPGSRDGIRRALLADLAKAAPDDLPVLIGRLVVGHIETGRWPAQLEDLDAAWTSRIGDVFTQSIESAAKALEAAVARQARAGSTASRHDQRVAALRRTLSILVRTLAQQGQVPGVEAAFDVIERACGARTGDPRIQAARATAVGLLNGGARCYWDGLNQRLARAPDLCKTVLEDLADNAASSVLSDLSDSQLAALWTQLSSYWRYQDDVPNWPINQVGYDEQVRRFRDGVLATLKRRGTSDTVRILQRLAATNPDLPWLAGYILEAEEIQRSQQWEPLLPINLTRILEDRSSRLVRSSADLADLVAQGIAVAAEELTRTGQLLWNNTGHGRNEQWRPKSEPDVGAWLSERLTERLVRNNVVINREVLVRQTSSRTALGHSVDIQADAPSARTEGIEPARCRVELKGNWNSDLMTAMSRQLANDYLIPDGLEHGVYVTAWFDTQLWTDESDSRRRAAVVRDRRDTELQLLKQADSLLAVGLKIRSVVIDIPRPALSARGKST